MNKGILNAIEASGPQTIGTPTEEDWKRYAHLLEHCDETPAEVKELAALIRKCGRSKADVCNDEAAIRELRTCQTCFRDAAKIGAKLAEAQVRIEQHDRDTLRLLEELKQRRRAEHDAIQGEIDGLNSQRAHAKQAAEKIHALKHGRPAPALTHEPDPDLRELE